MKTNLLAALIVFLCFMSVQSTAQQSSTFKGRSQSFYLELGGAGIGESANYEFRFRKNQLDGLGLRAGVGGIHIWLIGDISVTSVPVELNYIFSDDQQRVVRAWRQSNLRAYQGKLFHFFLRARVKHRRCGPGIYSRRYSVAFARQRIYGAIQLGPHVQPVGTKPV